MIGYMARFLGIHKLLLTQATNNSASASLIFEIVRYLYISLQQLINSIIIAISI